MNAETTTFRAAYWTDGQHEVRLTWAADAHRSDEELMTLATKEADETGLEIGDGEIKIGEWQA